MNKAGCCVEEIRATGQVERQVECTRNSIDQLGNALNRLEERLYQVLQCSPPQCGAEDCKEETLVPMAAAIRMNHRCVDSLRYQVEGILSRLEL
jgi:hypothetical protein